jgi:hypothetical protein
MLSKTFSAPTRSISMQCLSSTSSSSTGNEPFHTQKVDLIAELKMSKDITGIKKMKVERAKIEKGSEVYSDGKHQFSSQNFVDTVILKDAFIKSPISLDGNDFYAHFKHTLSQHYRNELNLSKLILSFFLDS